MRPSQDRSMNRLRPIRTPLAIMVATCVAGCATVPDRAADERYIVESEHAWAESVATGDTSTIERILADDFIGVDPKGKMYDKAEMVRDTREAPKYFASNHVNAVKVRFYGDTAVAQGDESWVRRADGSRGRFVWTDTWVRRNGHWQIVAAEDLIAPDVDTPK